MNYVQNDGNIILYDCKSFTLKDIFECGQCFRYEKITQSKYKIIAYSKVLILEKKGNDILFYDCTEKDFENIWFDYFDLNTDYEAIKEELSENDEIMKNAVAYAEGIRLLNQEPYECLLSFIISQNNNIPRIIKILNSFSRIYGKKIGEDYAFPILDDIKNITEEDLSPFKMGYRSKYILDAVKKLTDVNDLIDLSLPTEQLKNNLLSVKGVGNKVADCVLLFSCKKRECFPVDVWINRVISKLYLKNETVTNNEIQAFAKDKWGDKAGFAQQYLFNYIRGTSNEHI